jgi:CDP-diacylglycerol--glycerol-3-phosphate 3-phosphatidyltransferase
MPYIPNIITVIRIVLVPVFVGLLLHYRETGNDLFRWWAVVTFCVAVVTDGLDGLIARLKHQRTVLGAFLDPLADKVLIITAVIILSIELGTLARLPSWFPVLVISRDVIIVFGALIIHMIAGKVTPRPSVAGKSTTFFQMLTVLWVLFRAPYYRVPLYTAALFTVISGIEYIFLGMKQLHGNSVRQ